jgi:hypothetical protein
VSADDGPLSAAGVSPIASHRRGSIRRLVRGRDSQ